MASPLFTSRRGRWTVGDLRRQPEDEFNRYEIDDAVLIVSPRPSSRHQSASYRLTCLMDDAVRDAGLDWVVLQEVDVATGSRDDWLKVPDLVVVTRDAYECDPQEYDASDIVLAVEISGNRQSRTRDLGEKADAYAEVGIEHYWVLELAPVLRLTVMRLVGAAYERVTVSSGLVRVSNPLVVEVDPAALLRVERG